MSGLYGMQHLKNQYCSNCKRKKLEDRVKGGKDGDDVVMATGRGLSENIPAANTNGQPLHDSFQSSRGEPLCPAASSNSSYVSCHQLLCESRLSTPARHIRSYPLWDFLQVFRSGLKGVPYRTYKNSCRWLLCLQFGQASHSGKAINRKGLRLKPQLMQRRHSQRVYPQRRA
jgi:hypothetical protein